jgi:protein SCO1
MSRVEIGGSFTLTDHDGNLVSEATYRGRYMMIFFGFTRCRKVCPETLGKMSRVLERLGEGAKAFAPLYITVDPERDDPDTMKAFLRAGFPRFTGLTGSPEQINATRAAFRVFAQKAADEDDAHGYAVPHSALVYITDREGRYLFHFNDGVQEEKAVSMLTELPILRSPARPA